MNPIRAKQGAILSAAIVALFATSPDAADEAKKQVAEAAPVEVEIAPDSPRAAVRTFLELVKARKPGDAARYLRLPPQLTEAQAPDLAEKLAAVLEAESTFDITTISPLGTGDTDDQLQPGHDRVAYVHVNKSTVEPVRMVRHEGSEDWQFSSRTVGRIPNWYDKLPGAWAQKHLPSWLAKKGPAGLQFWQWIAIFVLLVVAWAVGYVVSRVVNKVASAWVKKTTTQWDDELLTLMQGPMTLAASLGVAAAVLAWIDLPEKAEALVFQLIKGGFLIVFFWLLMRGVDVARQVLGKAKFAHDPASRSLLSLGSRLTKAALFVVLVIAVLSQLGLPVGSLVAGLGIGGLAVALAGQKTLENLIGTFAIGIDHPFREGDTVKVRDFTATVESIGLRSTRFRTPERSIITVPNGKLADEQIETLAARDKLRITAAIGIRYGSNPDDVKAAIDALEADLKTKYELIDPKTVAVRLATLKEWTMGVELEAMVNTLDGTTFSKLRQEILLHVMAVLEAHHVKLQPMDVAAVKNGTALTASGTPRPSAPSKSL